MNGMATVYPRHNPNICKCGHDYREHVRDLGTVNNNICNQCLTNTPTTPNRHYFSGFMENPTSGFVAVPNFLNVRPYPYYCTGSYSGIFTRTVGTSVGNTLQISPSVAGLAFAGMNIMPLYPNPANNTTYAILTVAGSGLSITLARTPNVAIPNGTTIIFYGSFGSTRGPGLTANNQRGG